MFKININSHNLRHIQLKIIENNHGLFIYVFFSDMENSKPEDNFIVMHARQIVSSYTNNFQKPIQQ